MRSEHAHAYASPHAAAGPQGPQGPPFSAPSLNSMPCLTGPPLNSQSQSVIALSTPSDTSPLSSLESLPAESAGHICLPY